MKAGDLVRFKPGVLEERNIKEYGENLKYNETYELFNDGTDCPWFVINPGIGNHVFFSPDVVEVVEPFKPIKIEPNNAVEVYSQILLQKEVRGGLKVGDTLEVASVNLSGSYMIRTRTGGYSIVPPYKCSVVKTSKVIKVPCRCPYFVSPVTNNPDYNSEGIKQVPALIKPEVMTPMNKRIIKKQKVVAAEFLNKLRVINPAAIIAGGAPRNWEFNRPANDLDFFVQVPQGNVTSRNLEKSLETLGVTEVFNMATHSAPGVVRDAKAKGHQYDERMSDIHTVLEGKYQGEKIQVIFTKVETYGYIEDHFDTSINMIWCDLGYYGKEEEPKLVTRKTPEYQSTERTGIIFVYDNQNMYTNSHLERVASYFPSAPMAHNKFRKELTDNPSRATELCQPWEDILQEMMDEQSTFDAHF